MLTRYSLRGGSMFAPYLLKRRVRVYSLFTQRRAHVYSSYRIRSMFTPYSLRGGSMLNP